MFERSLVSDVIAEYHDSAPVRVVALAHALGLKVYTSASMAANLSGMIKRDKSKGGSSGFAIYVNANHAEVRRRFTIAHEIAHYILHENLIGDGIVEDALLRADNLTNSIERQANALAADILMPWSLIDKYKNKGMRQIEDLAAKFKVSRDAMSFRILGTPYNDTRQQQLADDWFTPIEETA